MCCVAFYFKNTLSIESRKKEQMFLKVFFFIDHIVEKLPIAKKRNIKPGNFQESHVYAIASSEKMHVCDKFLYPEYIYCRFL